MSKKFIHFFKLIRADKPIGFTLLMWPCFFGLATIPVNQTDLIHWYIYFLTGAFLMRSSGCIVNDLIDMNIDKKITRTADRPLATGKISVKQAVVLLFFLLILSLFILLQFNFYSILISCLSLPLILIYPFMKRFTYWPQLFLGIVFNWGVLIVSFQFYNELILPLIFLYVACIFWTLAYDTIYAYQDIDDDKKNSIKSTAVLFGKKGYKLVLISYIIFFIIIGFLGYKSSSSYISLAVMFSFIIFMTLFLNNWRLNSKSSSNYYFRINNYIALFCFIFLIVF